MASLIDDQHYLDIFVVSNWFTLVVTAVCTRCVYSKFCFYLPGHSFHTTMIQGYYLHQAQVDDIHISKIIEM